MRFLVICAFVLIALCATANSEVSRGRSAGKQAAKTSDWWQSAIFYQIYPRSFKDSNNDGVGDIRGIIQKLPYLKETGITATWLSPILKSPQVDYGYDIEDFTEVDELFGSMEDLEELFREAKKLGIKVIMDFVPNHTSDSHEWFKKSAAREKGFENFYVWHDGFPSTNGGRPLPPNNWNSVFSHSAWKWNDDRQQYFLHQFAPEQPDLNYREPRVVQAMKNVLTFWLDKGADGFRVDAVNHLFEDAAMRDEPVSGTTNDTNNGDYYEHIYTKDMAETYDMVSQWRRLIDDYNVAKGGDTRVLFTEAYTNIDDTIRFYTDSEGNPSSHFPFNFFLIRELTADSNARDFKAVIDKWMDKIPAGATPNWVLGNHDQPRFASRLGEEKIDGLLTLLLTLPGVAVTYNGEEIGMVDYRQISWEDTLDPQACNTNDPEIFESYSRDPQRTPFQWDATAFAGFKETSGAEPWIQLHPNYETLNLAAQQAADKSYYKLYQQLALLRQNDSFVYGDFHSMALTDDVLGFVRFDSNLAYAVLINFSNESATVDVNELGKSFNQRLEVVVAGSKSAHNVGDVINTWEVELGSYDALVLTSSAAVIKVSLLIVAMASLRNLF